jgi:phage protein D
MSWAPDYSLVVDGKEITTKVQRRLIGLTLRIRRGLEADQLDLTLDDHDGKLAIPPTGAEIAVALGWRGKPLIPCGTYHVDGTEHACQTIDQITIQASAADFGEQGPLKAPRTQSWHGETLGSLVDWIAADCHLAPACANELADIPIAHLDQTNESYANLLTRVSKDHDAMATIKGGRLLLLRRGRGITATGKPLQPVTLTRSSGDRHTWREADRDARYTGVRAGWWDAGQAKRQEVLVGDTGYVKTLRESYASEEKARAAAGAEWRRLQRIGVSMVITLARGMPDLRPEAPIITKGWGKKQIDRRWTLDQVEHTMTETGLTSRLTLEPSLD